MRDNQWEVKLDLLREFIIQSTGNEPGVAGNYRPLLTDLFNNAKRLFMFIYADLLRVPSELQMPTDKCWMQFIDPVKFTEIPDFQAIEVFIHGLLLIQQEPDSLLAFTLARIPSQGEGYSILIHSFKLSEIQPNQRSFFRFLARCTFMASNYAYMFKNYEKLYIGKREGSGDLVVHYAPRKIGLIGASRHDVMYSQGTEISYATFTKFDRLRARVV